MKSRYHFYIKNNKYYICDEKRKTCFEIVEKNNRVMLVEKKDVYKSFKKDMQELKKVEKEMKELIKSLRKWRDLIRNFEKLEEKYINELEDKILSLLE